MPVAAKTPKYQRILVALDGSERSKLALGHAVQLARIGHSKLQLLHVIDEVAFNMGQPRTPQEFWQLTRAAGKAILSCAKDLSTTNGVGARTKVVEIPTMGPLVRHVAEAIVQEGFRHRADLLVIGTHGRRGWSRLMLGSVAEGVLRCSPVPVLLVPAQPAPGISSNGLSALAPIHQSAVTRNFALPAGHGLKPAS